MDRPVLVPHHEDVQVPLVGHARHRAVRGVVAEEGEGRSGRSHEAVDVATVAAQYDLVRGEMQSGDPLVCNAAELLQMKV